ncbi:3-carboxymuconate cyclase, partial [Pseudohyphozyma bogoriensis]
MSATIFAAGYSGQITSLAFSATSASLTETSVVGSGIAPTWLYKHPSLPILYAVDEFDTTGGKISSYAIQADGSLKLTGEASSGGEGPVHLVMDEKEANLFVANYSAGSATRLSATAEGVLSSPVKDEVFVFEGTGPQVDRQEAPHAHGVFLDRKKEFLFVTDLGADKLRVFDIRQGKFERRDDVTLKAGGGARHLTFNPAGDKVFIVYELSNEVAIFSYSSSPSSPAPSFTPIQTLSVLPPSQKPYASQPYTAAAISFTASGQFLLVSNRSGGPGSDGPEDIIVAYKVAPDGSLVEEGLQELEVHGRGLRDFEVNGG